ncbi:hypothetical protein [Hymenobacter tenuis]
MEDTSYQWAGGGFENKQGGPADKFYSRQDGTPYSNAAEACLAVPEGARKERTVNIAGEEWWWKITNTTDAGLVKKVTGGGGADLSNVTGDVTFPGNVATIGAGKVLQSMLSTAVQNLLTGIGTLSSLTTTAKSTLVAAANELNGLITNLRSDVGTLASLGTTAKGSLVAAINEVRLFAANLTTNQMKGGPFRFKTLAELNAVDATLAIYPSSARVFDDGTNTGSYTRNSNGTAWIKDTATTAEIVATFPPITATSSHAVNTVGRYVLGASERLFRAKVAQAGPNNVLPVESDATAPGGTYWVEQSPDVASGQTGGGTTVVQATGTSTTAVMSQDAVSKTTGFLTSLLTSAKTSLVAAINELYTALFNRFNYRGDFVGSTTYAKNDVVWYLGVTYFAPAAFTAGSSFNAANWRSFGLNYVRGMFYWTAGTTGEREYVIRFADQIGSYDVELSSNVSNVVYRRAPASGGSYVPANLASEVFQVGDSLIIGATAGAGSTGSIIVRKI